MYFHSFVISWGLDRDFLKCQESVSLLDFPRELCVYIGVCFNISSGTLQLCLSLLLPTCTEPQSQPSVCAYSCLRSFLGIPITLSMCTALRIHVTFSISRNMLEFFKFPIDISFSTFFYYALGLCIICRTCCLLSQVVIKWNNWF